MKKAYRFDLVYKGNNNVWTSSFWGHTLEEATLRAQKEEAWCEWDEDMEDYVLGKPIMVEFIRELTPEEAEMVQPDRDDPQ